MDKNGNLTKTLQINLKYKHKNMSKIYRLYYFVKIKASIFYK